MAKPDRGTPRTTFRDWLNRTHVMNVNLNKLFTRTLYFSGRHIPNRDLCLNLMATVLNLFDNELKAKEAFEEVLDLARQEGWGDEDGILYTEKETALMAAEFYARANRP